MNPKTRVQSGLGQAVGGKGGGELCVGDFGFKGLSKLEVFKFGEKN